MVKHTHGESLLSLTHLLNKLSLAGMVKTDKPWAVDALYTQYTFKKTRQDDHFKVLVSSS